MFVGLVGLIVSAFVLGWLARGFHDNLTWESKSMWAQSQVLDRSEEGL